MERASLFYWHGPLKELPDLLVSLVTVEETQKDSGDWRFSLGLSSQPAFPVVCWLLKLLARQSSFCLNYGGTFHYLLCNLRRHGCLCLVTRSDTEPAVEGCGSVVECLLRKHKALDSIPSALGNRKNPHSGSTAGRTLWQS